VLLVDDLPEALQALGDQLSSLGLAPSAFADPLAALQAATQAAALGQPHELLVLDWRMGPLDGMALLARLRTLPGLSQAPAVLVSAHDDDLLRPQALDAGFDAVLVKPITTSRLHDTLAQLRRGLSVAATHTEDSDRAEALLRARHRGRRVLVAEDNEINREVATELLTAAGLEVEVAEDGLQAVDMALDGHFDLVLMDMQMPELDGLDATRRLRAAGRGTLPVVAMTANAFGEDRAACLAAGMNDHVAKPVDPEKLYATLLRWLPQTDVAQALEPVQAAPERAPLPRRDALPLQDRLAGIDGFNLGQGLHHVGGNLGTLRRVLTRFVQLYRDGIGALDLELAHSMRGACAAIGAVQLQATLLAYESAAGASGDGRRLRALSDSITRELASLVAQLEVELDVDTA
jgi:CheY-like chemotaxis protein